MSFYQRHLFFCCNKRPDGEDCCQRFDAEAMLVYAKELAKRTPLPGVRINKSGCLGRCEKGPVAVVYPDAIWYSYIDQDDVAEIVERHLRNGQIVERLLIDGGNT